MNLHQEAANWQDSEAINVDIVDRFTAYVNNTPYLCQHRDFIEAHAYGFGERCFHWLWRLLVGEMPLSFRFLEIGVYKGQVLSLVRLIANHTGRNAEIIGVTPLSSFSGDTGKFSKFPECNYNLMINDLHDAFNLEQPTIVVADSTSDFAHRVVSSMPPFDIVYVDGCHEYDYVVNDLMFYPALLKPGGYLVVDDAACDMKQPWGYFQGIEDVCKAVRTVIETDSQYEHLFACMHNRIWRRL